MPRGDGTGPPGGNRPGRGAGFRRSGGSFSAGAGGSCVCPRCGFKKQHIQGQPCNRTMCPQCGIPMIVER